MKETDLFYPVKTWLEERGYDVYSEVVPTRDIKRADVVAVQIPDITVVELKTTLSLELIGQAVHWKRMAHHVYVAVPEPKGRFNPYATTLLHREGIGLLGIKNVTYPEWMKKPDELMVRCLGHPKFNRNILPYLKEALTERHKENPPGGSQGGGYVTDYKLTMEKVRQELEWRTRDGSWVTIRDILDSVHTHYQSPKSSLAQSLLRFECSWCESKKENGRLWFRIRPIT